MSAPQNTKKTTAAAAQGVKRTSDTVSSSAGGTNAKKIKTPDNGEADNDPIRTTSQASPPAHANSLSVLSGTPAGFRPLTDRDAFLAQPSHAFNHPAFMEPPLITHGMPISLNDLMRRSPPCPGTITGDRAESTPAAPSRIHSSPPRPLPVIAQPSPVQSQSAAPISQAPMPPPARIRQEPADDPIVNTAPATVGETLVHWIVERKARRAARNKKKDICENCGLLGHVYSECIKISEDGDMLGCPICEVLDHSIDRCEKLPMEGETWSLEEKKELARILCHRPHLACIRSARFSWPELAVDPVLIEELPAGSYPISREYAKKWRVNHSEDYKIYNSQTGDVYKQVKQPVPEAEVDLIEEGESTTRGRGPAKKKQGQAKTQETVPRFSIVTKLERAQLPNDKKTWTLDMIKADKTLVERYRTHKELHADKAANRPPPTRPGA